MKHALVVGGTGMLSDVSLWLTKKGYHVSVIGRNPKRMQQLINQAQSPSSITPVIVDYRHSTELREEIKRIIKKNGHIDLVVAWIHSIGKDALSIISEEISNSNQPWRLFHVLGSSTNLEEVIKRVVIPKDCLYRQIKLGFILEESYSRWLTNEEISNGVIHAVQSDLLTHIVGTIEPWEMRP